MNSTGKIIIIGPAHPLRGGLASYNERLAREFQRNGHEVIIYTFSLQYPGFLFPGTTQYSEEPAPKDLNIRVKINSVNPLNWLNTGNEIRKEKPDVIVVRYWLPFMGPALGTILRIAAKNSSTRIICIADNIIPHEKRIGDNAFTRYFVKPVDGFITMSEKVLADLKNFAPATPAKFIAHPLYDNFGEKIPTSEARNHLKIGLNEKLILFFGFIRKYKGLDILLEAIHLLKERNEWNHKLLVAGEYYEDSKPYLEIIQRYGLDEDVIMHTSFIPDSEVSYYFSAADVVVQPYRNATQSGVTPLSYHYEVPMIVTNVGGLPAMVPHEKVGIVTEPDAASVADGITTFFKIGKQHFIPHIQSEKQKYSWKVMMDAILSF